jgi:hypothetical protein
MLDGATHVMQRRADLARKKVIRATFRRRVRCRFSGGRETSTSRGKSEPEVKFSGRCKF